MFEDSDLWESASALDPVIVEADDDDEGTGDPRSAARVLQEFEQELSELGDDSSYTELKATFDDITQKILDSLDSTWWFFGEEPGMDDVYERGGKALDNIPNQFGYEFFVAKEGNTRVFQCRYEWLREGGYFAHPDGRDQLFSGNIVIYLDFLTGFSMDCVELMFMLGEYSSIYTNEQKTKMSQGGAMTPPVPVSFFAGYDPDRILVNVTALDRSLDSKYYGVHLQPSLAGTGDPKSIKWWCRVNIKDDDKFPIPGEFVGLGVRLMPDAVAGTQTTSPFVYSGNWIDSVYYTGAEILSVDESGDYPVYLVQWRKKQVEVKPTDWAKYEVGDRVTLLKRVDTEKYRQTWEDTDATEINKEEWVIAPIMFYGIEYGTG